MVTLSDSQRRRLKVNLELLELALADFAATVPAHGLPNAYTELNELMERQRVAVGKLLDSGETGCELNTLAYRQSMISGPHLENLAHIGSEVKKLPSGDEQKKFFETESLVLHSLKNQASAASYAYDEVAEIMSTQPKPPRNQSGDGKQWTL